MRYTTADKTLQLPTLRVLPAGARTLSGLLALSLSLLCSAPSFAQTSVEVTFKVDMTGVDAPAGAFITGSFTGPEGQWYIVPMTGEGSGVYSYAVGLDAGAEGAYYFLRADDWNSREAVPAACAEMWNVDRKYAIPGADITYSFKYGSCEEIDSN